MSKQIIHFGLLLMTLSLFHTSIEGLETRGIHEELADWLRNQIFERTNHYRQIHGVNPLELNDEMNEVAQRWANSLADDFEYKHDPSNTLYGENISITKILPNIGGRIIDLWYSYIGFVEIDDGNVSYDRQQLGLLTQLLWRSSEKMGVGVSISKIAYEFYVVTLYDPKGNGKEEYLNNVPIIKEEHILKGREELKLFDLERTFLSNSVTERVHWAVSSTLPNPYSSNIEPKVLSEAEASRIRKQVFKKCNLYRLKHGMPVFKIYKQMNNYAQIQANNLVEKGNTEKGTAKDEEYGEILYKTPPLIFGEIGEIAVSLWHNQISNARENMTEEEFQQDVQLKDLTQLLWKDSEDIGVGVSIDHEGYYRLVVNLSPKGNIPRSFLKNLPKFHQKDIDEGKVARDELNKLIGDTE